MPHIHEKIDFTASVFIVNGDAVLLRKHEKIDRWLQPGGHIELDEDPNEAVVREAKEETGLEVTLVGVVPSVFDGGGYKNLLVPRFMNRHDFSTNVKSPYITPGHEHIDLVYFGTSATRTLSPSPQEKQCDIRWFTESELDDPSFNLFSSVKFYARTALRELASKK